jgi:periplasmic protein TonB
MVRKHQEQSTVVLVAVVALHVAALAALLHYQPGVNAASAQIMHVSLVAAPAPTPVVQPPESPKPPARPQPVQKTITPAVPLDPPSETAISAPPAPPKPPAETIAAAPVAAPEPPAPVVLPRFDADYLQNPPPVYPALARRAGEQGRVLLRVVVRADGTAQSVELRQSSGSQRLDEAALDAVRRWRFVPARQGSLPISAAVIVPIVFSLEG